MMKRILPLLTLCLAFMVTSNVSAQLADGSTAPDWTLTDLDGTEWNLYTLLDEGKTVIIDFSTHWCGPCWGYHTGGALEGVYEEHGPDGDNTMMVFFIEGDGTATMDEMLGDNSTGGNSQGDWIDGTGYPIINVLNADNNMQVITDYAVPYWPTIYTVCPDRSITMTGQISADQHVAFRDNDCVVPMGENNSGLEAAISADSYCGEFTPSVNVKNFGEGMLTSCDVTLSVNGEEMETISWTGSLSSFQAETVDFASITSEDDLSLTFEATNSNGAAADDFPNDNTFEQTVANYATEGQISFSIYTDFWAEEVSWELRDENGSVLYTNPVLENDTEYTFDYDLASAGCMEFEISDGYGDGILNGLMSNDQIAYGAISLALSDGTIIFDDIDYGSGTTIIFNSKDGEVLEAPVASFDMDVMGATVTVTNTTQGEVTDWMWDFGDGTTSTEMNPAPHTYTGKDFDFDVCLTASNATGDSEDCKDLTVSIVGLDELTQAGSIEVFPVPANELVNIAFNLNEAETVDVSVTNAAGILMATQNVQLSTGAQQLSIETADYPAGLYMINMTNGSTTITKRFVVTH